MITDYFAKGDKRFLAVYTDTLETQKYYLAFDEYRDALILNPTLHLEIFEVLFLEYKNQFVRQIESGFQYHDARIMEKIEKMKSLI